MIINLDLGKNIPLWKAKKCSTIFLDVGQVFAKVWHRSLPLKINKDLPKQYYEILKSDIPDWYFWPKFEDENSALKKLIAGLPPPESV